MLINSRITIYHKEEKDREDRWVRYNYNSVWTFGGKGAGVNKGYENANDIEVRIPYNLNENLDVDKFKIGDIIYRGVTYRDIENQNELEKENCYNITSITNNMFGNNAHIHLGGK